MKYFKRVLLTFFFQIFFILLIVTLISGIRTSIYLLKNNFFHLVVPTLIFSLIISKTPDIYH